MNYKRIGRALMCLVLICCLMVQTVPRADATGAGLAAPIVQAAGVTVSAPVALTAMAISLGVMAGTNDDFQNLVTTAASSGFEWVKDGTVELLRTVDALGNQAFYVAGEFLEDLKTRFFDLELLSFVPVYGTSIPAGTPIYVSHYKYSTWSGYITADKDCEAMFLTIGSSSYLTLVFPSAPSFKNSSGGGIDVGSRTSAVVGSSSRVICYFNRTKTTDNTFACPNYISSSSIAVDEFVKSIYKGKYEGYTEKVGTSYDLSLGQIPTYSLDGTVHDDAFRDYMSKQIRFQNQDNPEDPEGDESNYDWMVPLSLGAAGTVYAMTQAEQWLGSTPSDFSDYETVTDYTIVDTPTVGGFPGILTTPNIGAGTDDDTIPVVPPAIGGGTTTIDPVEGTLSDANAQTFLDSIGSFFSSWFDSILKWLEAIWELIKAGVITLAEAIAAIPAAIAEAITDVLVWAFVPSESYLDAEVTALCSEFPLADSCKNLITAFRDSLSGLGGEPPVIYIHLEDYEGSYNIGGTVPILDMRWYARYKPTVDTLLSSLLWIFFIWRVLVHAPSIISGVAGDIDAFNSGPSGGYFSADNPYRGQFERPARGRFESRRNRK